MLRGSLTSRVLDFDDLGALFGGGKMATRQAAALLPDTALHTERLRQMDADVDYAADAIRSQDFPLRGLVTHISLENGVLDLKPLAFGFTQGKLSGSLQHRCAQRCAGDHGGCPRHRHSHREFHQGRGKADQRHGRGPRRADRPRQFGAQGGGHRQRHGHGGDPVRPYPPFPGGMAGHQCAQRPGPDACPATAATPACAAPWRISPPGMACSPASNSCSTPIRCWWTGSGTHRSEDRDHGSAPAGQAQAFPDFPPARARSPSAASWQHPVLGVDARPVGRPGRHRRRAWPWSIPWPRSWPLSIRAWPRTPIAPGCWPPPRRRARRSSRQRRQRRAQAQKLHDRQKQGAIFSPRRLRFRRGSPSSRAWI